MSFVLSSTTLGSAVATGGTFTIVAPTATLAGAIKAGGGHQLIVRQMMAVFNFPNDWTETWSGATATITYNGTTTIPAGAFVQVQWEVTGDNINFPYHQVSMNQFDTPLKRYRGCFGQVFRVDFGSPLNANTTLILATTPVVDTVLHTLAAPVELDVPRILQVVSSSTDTTVVTIRGFDEYGVAMTESFTLNNGTPVLGKKAFKVVYSYQCLAAMANNLSIGSGLAYGLPYYLPARTGSGIGSILKEEQDGTSASAGTPVGGVLTKATATTGDVRGTIIPNTPPDGTKVYSVYLFVADTVFNGVPQYGL